MAKKKEVRLDVLEIKCPGCNTGFYYYRAKTDDYRCRKCGSTFYWNKRKNRVSLKKEREVKA